jgi:hypothetical protein
MSRRQGLSIRCSAATRAEAWCVAGFVALLLIAIAAPAIEQPAAYHAFADARAWAGMPNAANVLSNALFAVAGVLVAIVASQAGSRLGAAARAGLAVTAVGLLLTSAGSAYYHWRPGNATLVWDRLPLTVTFAGLMALVVAQRVSERLAWAALPLLILLGPASVFYWQASGNVTPYGVLQIGAMLALLVIVVLLRRADDPIAWWWLFVGYGIAKGAEAFDGAVFEATRGALSGHTLKHLAAAIAAGGIAWPLFRRNR